MLTINHQLDVHCCNKMFKMFVLSLISFCSYHIIGEFEMVIVLRIKKLNKQIHKKENEKKKQTNRGILKLKYFHSIKKNNNNRNTLDLGGEEIPSEIALS